MLVLLETWVAPTLASTNGLAHEAQSSIVGLMTEVSVKLIKNHVLTEGLGRYVFRVDIRVLPCPPHFDQVVFCEPHTKGNAIAWARIEHDAWVHPHDMGFNGKAHAGAITDEWSEIKTNWFCLRLLLCAEGRRKHDDEYRRDDDDCFLGQCISD